MSLRSKQKLGVFLLAALGFAVDARAEHASPSASPSAAPAAYNYTPGSLVLPTQTRPTTTVAGIAPSPIVQSAGSDFRITGSTLRSSDSAVSNAGQALAHNVPIVNRRRPVTFDNGRTIGISSVAFTADAQ